MAEISNPVSCWGVADVGLRCGESTVINHGLRSKQACTIRLIDEIKDGSETAVENLACKMLASAWVYAEERIGKWWLTLMQTAGPRYWDLVLKYQFLRILELEVDLEQLRSDSC